MTFKEVEETGCFAFLLHLLKVTRPIYFIGCMGMGIGMGVDPFCSSVGVDPLWLWAGLVVAGVELPALIAPGVLSKLSQLRHGKSLNVMTIGRIMSLSS